MFNTIFETIPLGFIIGMVLLGIWEIIWKGIALWKAGRNNHLIWFLCILIINTAGILPIIYIFAFSKKKAVRKEIKKVSKKRR